MRFKPGDVVMAPVPNKDPNIAWSSAKGAGATIKKRTAVVVSIDASGMLVTATVASTTTTPPARGLVEGRDYVALLKERDDAYAALALSSPSYIYRESFDAFEEDELDAKPKTRAVPRLLPALQKLWRRR